ncbi:uncharacterized protein LOC122510021 [Leptopilina heterotoma]|uniref:uncharacterized protein LOC122510021 n=1 Tax=Leptopilina heterotoma TaxID=63436 RepID=UPI001CA7E4C6|nr:uncharacterized protein LOC122510021 [Leptopilina heterotoma]XP_043480343.1 uncharacterized protein LOC122510021 [Leptopilina heterotoma]
MIRIAIICLLISMTRSRKCEFSIEEVNELKQAFVDAGKQMEIESRGGRKNAAIVIGTAMSGKSTLINYLIGNQMEGYRGSSRYDRIIIRKFDVNSTGPEISSGLLPVTNIPSKWNSKRTELQNLTIWNTPGFQDIRGPLQDLKNSFYLYRLTRRMKSVKFILVVNFYDIESDINENFISLLNNLEKFFNGKFKNFFSSISVIFSKAPYNFREFPIRYEYINNKLNNLLSQSRTEFNLSNDSKDFIQHVVNHNKQVAFFRNAEVIGKVNSSIDENIIQAIRNTRSINKKSLQDVSFSFSAGAEVCLRDTEDLLFQNSDIKKLNVRIKKFFIEKSNYLLKIGNRDINKLNEYKIYLSKMGENISPALNKNSDIQVKIQSLKGIDYSLQKLIMEQNYANKIKLIKFSAFILRSSKILILNYLFDALLNVAHAKIKKLIPLSLLLMKNITTNTYDKVITDVNKSSQRKIRDLSEKTQNLEKSETKKGFWEFIFQQCADVI